MSNKVEIKIVSGAEASLLKEDMWQIYKEFYICSKGFFYSRIKEDKYYALYMNKGNLVGFTGLFLGKSTFEGKKVRTFGLGFTVLMTNFRGQQLLQKTCLKLFLKLFIQKPFQPIYFWCHASTYKSYLILTKLLVHYPSRHQEIPTNYTAFMDSIGREHFGGQYDEKTKSAFFEGFVLQDDSAKISTKHLENPAIRFYHQMKPANPIGKQGVNGLILVAPFNWTNALGWVKDFYKKLLW
jgi:hypothetical protein